MKYLVIFLILIGLVGIMLLIGNASAEASPLILSKVELWGPSSFIENDVKFCIENTVGQLGPWAVGWIEIKNTKDKTITAQDITLHAGAVHSLIPITIGAKESCIFQTQDQITTRIGPGGSGGNGPPFGYDNSTIVFDYTVEENGKKTHYTDTTPEISDISGDTRIWQLIDGNWLFKEGSIDNVLPRTNGGSFSTDKTVYPLPWENRPPLKQFKDGIDPSVIHCNDKLVLIQKYDGAPACVKPETKEKLIERGWARSDSPLINLGPIDADIVQKQTIILDRGIDDLDSGTSFHPIYKKTILGVNSTITWFNTKSEPVQLQSDENYYNVTIQPKGSFSFTYDTVGIHRYHDPINWKRGSIMVSTEKMESSNLKPSKLLEKTPDEIAKIIMLAAINDDKITKKRLDNSIMLAYVTEQGGNIIVPKSLCIICTNSDFRPIQYRIGLAKPLIYPQDEVEGLKFANEFMGKIGYHTDGTEWIDAVDFGSYIRVTLQQRVQGWIIPNHVVDFTFFRDNTSISLGRWYDDITSYQFMLSQEDAKIISKDYMQKEIDSNPTLQKFQYEFQEINEAQVIIIDDKPVYVVPVSFKSSLQQKFENGHCGGPEYFAGMVMVEGKTGSVLGWDYPMCE